MKAAEIARRIYAIADEIERKGLSVVPADLACLPHPGLAEAATFARSVLNGTAISIADGLRRMAAEIRAEDLPQ